LLYPYGVGFLKFALLALYFLLKIYSIYAKG